MGLLYRAYLSDLRPPTSIGSGALSSTDHLIPKNYHALTQPDQANPRKMLMLGIKVQWSYKRIRPCI